MAEGRCGRPLLRPGAGNALRLAHAAYPPLYDDVLDDVHERLVRRGAATKLDLAALLAWKHVQNAPWMRELLSMQAEEVEAATRQAFAPNLTDDGRVAALGSLPGFKRGRAFASVLVTAWDPARFGVYDRLVNAKRSLVVTDACSCDWSPLPTYWAHLRLLASELEAERTQ